jgi:AraC family transcriptional regulator of adaptative response/methylated-DNA-[protein]-cysteine methyltransferase
VAFGSRVADLESVLASEFPNAERTRDAHAMAREIAALSAHLDRSRAPLDLPLDVKGTVFQQRVWRALRQIPAGTTRTYAEVAASIGRPTAARAVARACAANPVALVVPCHRVVPQTGGTGGYRWGGEVKAKILAIEQRSAE